MSLEVVGRPSSSEWYGEDGFNITVSDDELMASDTLLFKVEHMLPTSFDVCWRVYSLLFFLPKYILVPTLMPIYILECSQDKIQQGHELKTENLDNPTTDLSPHG